MSFTFERLEISPAALKSHTLKRLEVSFEMLQKHPDSATYTKKNVGEKRCFINMKIVRHLFTCSEFAFHKRVLSFLVPTKTGSKWNLSETDSDMMMMSRPLSRFSNANGIDTTPTHLQRPLRPEIALFPESNIF